MKYALVFFTILLVSAKASAESPSSMFFEAIKAYCGQAFAGKVVKGNASDESMRQQLLVMHVRACSDTELKIPFHVGEDRSRTWVIRKTASGMTLQHDHRHQDGSADKITLYGGHTANAGSSTLQSFPADQYSKDLFIAHQMPASTANTWTVEIIPGEVYRYSLSRAGREFMVDFDLTKPITPPVVPWGHDAG